jgi:serine/threonine protein kinase/tetratricopeptide (TPR) repeat protein
MTSDGSSEETLSIQHGSDYTDVGGRPPAQTAPGMPVLREIGPYKLLEVLGEGAFGTVYLAEQQKPVHRRVALKIVKLGMDTRQVITRFEVEREALALMNHPNVAKVFDAGATETGRPYFVMEYVAGIPITDYCDKHRLNTEERLRLFIDVCHAVQHAHQKGIIHRDIKPSNVLVTVQDEKPVPKVIDFGVAKATQHRLTERTLFTEQGQLIGTPGYMSPEQAEMTALDIDTRTDIYSLGVLLYELLVGALPFDPRTLFAGGFAEIQRIIREVDPPKPSTRLSALRSVPRVSTSGPATPADPKSPLPHPPAAGGSSIDDIAHRRHTEPKTLLRQVRGDLDWIIMKALEKDRTRRYATAFAFADDIIRHLNNEPVQAGPPNRLYRLQKFVRRNRGTVLVSTLFVTVLAGAAVGMTRLYFRAERQRGQAEQARGREAEQREVAQANEVLARDEADRAERERSRADREALTARQVSDFLVGLFNVSDPLESQGAHLTTREILDRGAARVRYELRDQPLIRGALLETLGNVHAKLGLFEQAQRLLEESLSIRQSSLVEPSEEIASSLRALGDVLDARGEYEKALRTHEDALRMRRSLFGDRHPQVAESMAATGNTLLKLSRNDEAESLYNQALAIRRDLFGDGSPEVALSLIDLGTIAQVRGDFQRAEGMYLEALSIRKTRFGDRHPLVLEALHYLAALLYFEGELERAEPLYREVLSGYRFIFGEESPEVASCSNHLAALLLNRHRYDEAEPLVRDALQIDQKRLGNEHPRIASDLNTLGAILREKGDLTEAERLHRTALDMRRKLFGDNSEIVAVTLTSLGACLAKLARFEEAEQHLLEAYRILSSTKGESYFRTVETATRLADLYAAWERPDREKFFRDLLPHAPTPP